MWIMNTGVQEYSDVIFASLSQICYPGQEGISNNYTVSQKTTLM